MTQFLHGGDVRGMAAELGVEAEEILDFSANINPLGPPEGWRIAAHQALEHPERYPDPQSRDLRDLIAAKYASAPERIVVANGASEALDATARALCRGNSNRKGVVPVPSYSDYLFACIKACATRGSRAIRFTLSEAGGFALDMDRLLGATPEDALVVIGRPNNPTGRDPGYDAIVAAAKTRPDVDFVVDESFLDFVQDSRSVAAARLDNVIAVRSLTKFYSIPALRIGFVDASPEVRNLIATELPCWSVNAVAMRVAEYALRDDAFAERSRRFVAEERARFVKLLAAIPGLAVYPSEANFLLLRLTGGSIADAHELARRLLANHRVAIRTFEESEYLDKSYFRIAVRSADEDDRVADALSRELSGKISARIGRRAARRAKPLMIQGVSSNAGKTVLVAGLCRILSGDGVRVAPFKAQNMTLNSYILPDGREMGRAQALQAFAAGIQPDARMNPVLLMPDSDSGSRVAVLGESVGHMRAAAYFDYRPTAFRAAQNAYDSLADEYDAVILEGAGSPGEVNLKHGDIVNMRMAQYARSPVLVAGDIDRGGLFAAFVGIMGVLEEWERRQVAGWIVNRFRGDASLLEPALEYTKLHTGRPVVGVVPHMHDLDLPEEDSLAYKESGEKREREPDAVRLFIPALPGVGRFSDLDPLRYEPDLMPVMVRSAADMPDSGFALVPDSRNPAEDAAWLIETGIAGRLADMLGNGGRVFFLGSAAAMPGATLRPFGLPPAAGLGLFQADFLAKRLEPPRRVRFRGEAMREFAPAVQCLQLDGSHPGEPWLRGEDGGALGWRHGGAHWTPLTGLFDDDPYRRVFIDALREASGKKPHGSPRTRYGWDDSLDRLAARLRGALDMDAIYGMLGL